MPVAPGAPAPASAISSAHLDPRFYACLCNGVGILGVTFVVFSPSLLSQSSIMNSSNIDLTQAPELRSVAPKPAKTFDFKLEGLRGLAALTVVLGHTVVIRQTLDPHYQPSGVFAFQAPGHLSVLIFFILSGYVIGLTNQRPLQRNGIGPYLKKRLVRIYPIYLVSMLLALAISQAVPASVAAANLTFTQVLLAPVLSANAPSWSLHYEILFYLLFIPVSYFRMSPVLVCLGSFLAGLAVLLLANWPGAPLLTSYLFGFSFWTLGLVLVNISRHGAAHYTSLQLLSAFLLFFSLEETNQLQTVYLKVTQALPGLRWSFSESVPWVERAIALVDFTYLPYCVLVLLIFTNRSFPYQKWLTYLLYLLPAYSLVYLYHNRADAVHFQHYLIPVCSYLLSVLLLVLSRSNVLEGPADWLLAQTIKLGALSYGLYIIHYPILKIFGLIEPFSGHWYTFLVRFIAFMALSLLAAALLEKRFQPWARRFF
ncbi:acyltransferase family protein [Hymenobacter armeniacus]|uniref:Acyltransferase n=1 Tax=Hymenobacter armeniacus TaxID=2771358 RepID=A0ABR8JS90_9BACT|nr:acyltransferase [Hymenobacter armeniacus]MBD2721781.1 acyltransferase [Hymenobacter armeniacus]